jgi:hypothetical protein
MNPETDTTQRSTPRTLLRAAPALAALTLLAILLPTAASADEPIASGPPGFGDPVGDVSSGPDVTQVAVLHAEEPGPLIFWVSVASEPVLLDKSVLELRFDVDLNPSTGSGSGAERLIHRLWTGSTALCTWTGGSWSCGSAGVSSTYVDGSLVVRTTKQALGLGAEVDFSVAGYNAPNVDFAPDSGTWRYSLDPATPTGCPGQPGLECLTTTAGHASSSPRPVFRR